MSDYGYLFTIRTLKFHVQFLVVLLVSCKLLCWSIELKVYSICRSRGKSIQYKNQYKNQLMLGKFFIVNIRPMPNSQKIDQSFLQLLQNVFYPFSLLFYVYHFLSLSFVTYLLKIYFNIHIFILCILDLRRLKCLGL